MADLMHFFQGARGAMSGAQARSHVMVSRAVQIGEVAGGAFVGAFLTTKMGGAQGTMVGVGPVKAPLTLSLAALAFGAAAFDFGGSHNQDLANLGTGLAAAYFAGVGRAAGLGQLSFATGATPNRAAYNNFVGARDRR